MNSCTCAERRFTLSEGSKSMSVPSTMPEAVMDRDHDRKTKVAIWSKSTKASIHLIWRRSRLMLAESLVMVPTVVLAGQGTTITARHHRACPGDPRVHPRGWPGQARP